MKAFSVTWLLVAASCFGAEAPQGRKVEAPSRDVSFTVSSTYGKLEALGEEVNAVKHPDYSGLIREVAGGSESALSTFFRVSASTAWDAAAAEAHMATMQKVLLHWGDLGFSKALKKEDTQVCKRVRRFLGNSEDSIRLLFPLTDAVCQGK